MSLPTFCPQLLGQVRRLLEHLVALERLEHVLDPVARDVGVHDHGDLLRGNAARADAVDRALAGLLADVLGRAQLREYTLELAVVAGLLARSVVGQRIDEHADRRAAIAHDGAGGTREVRVAEVRRQRTTVGAHDPLVVAERGLLQFLRERDLLFGRERGDRGVVQAQLVGVRDHRRRPAGQAGERIDGALLRQIDRATGQVLERVGPQVARIDERELLVDEHTQAEAARMRLL
jgi:hypothetical protein